MAQQAAWFDGQVAVERPVQVRPDGDHLVLIDRLGEEHPVPKADLVRLDAPAGEVRLGRRGSDGWRLVFSGPIDPDIAAALPRRKGSVAPTVNRGTMAMLIGLLSVATAGVGLIIFAPQTVARLMPMSWERRIGAVYDLPVDVAKCDDREAQAALARILDRVDSKARGDGFTIELVDFDEANAAALPGGRMIVLNGLFEDVKDPDAVAGIVAHEIAHVRRRHVAAGMIRELGLGTVVTLMGGGAVASNASGLLSLKFTRSAEAEADADAIAMLEHAGVDPRPTAAAFEQFRKKEGNFPEWLGSHPASGGRAGRFAASYKPGRSYRPVLDKAQAKALIDACNS